MTLPRGEFFTLEGLYFEQPSVSTLVGKRVQLNYVTNQSSYITDNLLNSFDIADPMPPLFPMDTVDGEITLEANDNLNDTAMLEEDAENVPIIASSDHAFKLAHKWFSALP